MLCIRKLYKFETMNSTQEEDFQNGGLPTFSADELLLRVLDMSLSR